jgi:NADPH:quinone reductase-like Zn-dependent oxidoreductase
MSTEMLAATLGDFGAADVLRLQRLPCPAPKAGEILVRVQAAAVNPIDVRRRGGYGRRLLALMGAARMPLVLGNDFAGTVAAVGRGVTGLRVGDAVFGAKPPSSAGTHASHVVVRAEHALRQPAGVDVLALAALPYNFLTASRAIADAGITAATVRGREVLVHGASGGVGLLATWLLHDMGAQVTAVGGAAGLAACQFAGAATVINRHRHALGDLPRRYAATLNFANWDDEALLLRLLVPDALGHATTVHPMLGNFDRHGLLGGALATLRQKRRMRALAPKSARYAWTVFRPQRRLYAALAQCAPRLPQPACTGYPLNAAAMAHLHVEHDLPGRAVLIPS